MSSSSSTEGAAVATGVAALALLLVGGLLLSGLSRTLGKALRSLRETAGRVASDDLNARADVTGPGSELAELGEELNALIENRQREILNLRLEAGEAAALRESSRQLIEECIYAREPLAKQHPGLAAAYATAAIRHAGQEKAGENETVDGLVDGVDTAGRNRGNRGNLRWTPRDVNVAAPMPSKLVNMSVSGMAVESNRGLPVGGSWVFRVGTDTLAYDIPGRICWCRLERTIKVDDEVQPVYRTGIEFDDELSGKAFDFFGPASLGTGAAESAAW